jgi:hypothetical protein
MNNQTEKVFSYENGDVYMGEMLNNLRHGRGTLRTPATVYNPDGLEYTSETAAENAHLAKWHEYIGEWSNDKLHGCGVHLWKSGNGAEMTLFHGEWINGQPQRNRRLSQSTESVSSADTPASSVGTGSFNDNQIHSIHSINNNQFPNSDSGSGSGSNIIKFSVDEELELEVFGY